MNSTTDLRNRDSELTDAGPADVSGDASVRTCPPPIALLEIEDATNSIFAIDFAYEPGPDCDTTLRVSNAADSFEATIAVVPGELRATFVYTGPRVALIDEMLREREFDFGDGTSLLLTMPVERFSTASGAYEFSYLEDPSVDIADNGRVVFAAADVALGGAGAASRVYLWYPNGTFQEVETPNDGSFAYPKISDDGLLVAYIQTNTTDNNVIIRDFDGSHGPEFVDIRADEDNHLDLRDDPTAMRGSFFLLVNTTEGNNVRQVYSQTSGAQYIEIPLQSVQGTWTVGLLG